MTSGPTQVRGGGGPTHPDPLTHGLAHRHGVSAGQPGRGAPGHKAADGCFPAGAVGHGLRGQGTRGTESLMTSGLTTVMTTIQFLVANFSAIEISRTSDIETAEQLTRTLTTEANLSHHDLTRVTVSSMTRETARVLFTCQEFAANSVTHKLHLTLDHRGGGSTGASLP